MEKIKMEIAGEIALSDDPGATMRKWREIFNISQVEFAKHLDITVSTISDYEGNRRKSPGTHVIRRFVNALFDIDMMKGGLVTSAANCLLRMAIWMGVPFLAWAALT